MNISYKTPNLWFLNDRPLPAPSLSLISDFREQFAVGLHDMKKVIESIFNHPNQINLADFLRHCLDNKISFVFLGDRAGVGTSNRARDVFSFDSLGDMITFSQESIESGFPSVFNVPNVKKFNRQSLNLMPDRDFMVKNYGPKKDYSNNYNIRGKNGQFISLTKETLSKESAMEVGTQIHENWAKVFNAHTPPPIPENYNYYKNLKLGSPEYNGSRQFVKNYVSQNSVSVKEAIAVFNKGVSDFGNQFESLVKTCPDLNSKTISEYPPLDKVDRYFANYQARHGSIPSVRKVSKRFKEYKKTKKEWVNFLSPKYL